MPFGRKSALSKTPKSAAAFYGNGLNIAKTLHEGLLPKLPFAERVRNAPDVEAQLDEPLADIPDLPEDTDPGYRRINQAYETWKIGALRLMENSFDAAHIAFVHKATFGDINRPKPEKYEMTPEE